MSHNFMEPKCHSSEFLGVRVLGAINTQGMKRRKPKGNNASIVVWEREVKLPNSIIPTSFLESDMILCGTKLCPIVLSACFLLVVKGKRGHLAQAF